MKALGHGNFCTSIPVAPLGARNWYIFNFTVKTFTVKIGAFPAGKAPSLIGDAHWMEMEVETGSSFFTALGTESFRMPSSNLALISSGRTAVPT